MFELKQSFYKMCNFCCSLPPFFDNPDLSKFVHLLLDYFEETTGQHSQFTDVITSLVDEALDMLSNYVEKGKNDDNSFNATSGGEHVAGGVSGRKNAVTFQGDYHAGGLGASPDNDSEPLPRQVSVAQPNARLSAFSLHTERNAYKTGPTGTAGGDPKIKASGLLTDFKSAAWRTPADMRHGGATAGLGTAGQAVPPDASNTQPGGGHFDTSGWVKGEGGETFPRAGLQNYSKVLPGHSVVEHFSKDTPKSSQVVVTNSAAGILKMKHHGGRNHTNHIIHPKTPVQPQHISLHRHFKTLSQHLRL